MVARDPPRRPLGAALPRRRRPRRGARGRPGRRPGRRPESAVARAPGFSARLPCRAPDNVLARAVRARRRRGAPVLDLTESNPTRAGLAAPPEALASVLAAISPAAWSPTPPTCVASGGPGGGGGRLCRAGAGRRPRRDRPDRQHQRGVRLAVRPPERSRRRHPGRRRRATRSSSTWPGWPVPGRAPTAWSWAAAGPWTWRPSKPRARRVRPRAVVVVAPDDPTGSVPDAEEWRALARSAAARGRADRGRGVRRLRHRGSPDGGHRRGATARRFPRRPHGDPGRAVEVGRPAAGQGGLARGRTAPGCRGPGRAGRPST